MRRIAILQYARLNSERVPNKLLQHVGQESLLDRGMRYLSRLGSETAAIPLVACNPADGPILKAAARFGVEILELGDEARTAEAWPELIRPLVGPLTERFDWIWDANLFCRPFLRLSTGLAVLEQIGTCQAPFTCVLEKRGVVWNEAGKVILGAGLLANTRRNPVYAELAHLAYVWPVHMLGWDEVQLATHVTIRPIRLDWAERIDIDTVEDLQFAQMIANVGSMEMER